MNMYIGTKQLNAKKMTLGEYNTNRGWIIPENEKPSTEGYCVFYPDNHVSWSPKKTFEDSYCTNGKFNFGHALYLLSTGFRVQRSGWNGKGMFAFMVQESTFKVNREPLLSILGENTSVNYRPHIDLQAADGTIGVWNPNMMDILAQDWSIA